MALIAFNRGGNVYTATATGASIKQITTGGGLSGATWSPDGKRLAYKNKTGTTYVRTMATGKTVTVAVGADSAPIWSPTGQSIAFVAKLATAQCGEQGAFTVPAAGGASPRLIWDPQSDNCPHGPDVWGFGGYTQDGSALLITACVAYRSDSCAITHQALDSSVVTHYQVGGTILAIGCYEESETPPDGSASKCGFGLHLSDPRVGPNGNGILFSGKGGYEGSLGAGMGGTLPGSTAFPTSSTPERIYAVDRSGTGLHQVSTATSGYNPTWSPKGDQVLFTQQSGSATNIMRVVGTSATATPTVLIKNASQADWQPVV